MDRNYSHHVKNFRDEMNEECELSTCGTCKYFYTYRQAGRKKVGCFKDDLIRYVNYQSNKH